jgi:hypothetical protein
MSESFVAAARLRNLFTQPYAFEAASWAEVSIEMPGPIVELM